MSDSSDTSCDEDDEAPLTEEDLQEMLWLHKQQKIAQQMYYLDKDVSCCGVCNSFNANDPNYFILKTNSIKL